MLDGNGPADRLFGVIWTIDEGDDWKDRKVRGRKRIQILA